MSQYRIFCEKRPGLRAEADSLRRELNENLGLDIRELRLLAVYDLEGFTPRLLEAARWRVFGERAADEVSDRPDFGDGPALAVEYLPGQFDQRAASAEDCVRLIDPQARVSIRSARLLAFDRGVTEGDMERIRRYIINPVECREKDMSRIGGSEKAAARPVETLEGFAAFGDAELERLRGEMGLAMSLDDLRCARDYFRGEGRDPNETEIRILDTYWSDHCRHTTFNTRLESIEIEPSDAAAEIAESLELYRRMRRETGRGDRPETLMDMATLGARWLRSRGMLDDLEASEENNACSIYIDADEDGRTERWLLQFKNETHNHPTEIEPFGGASTCLGGAIRDPLSGRAYVYQAMRVSGAGDIWQPVADTLPGKLPQKVISARAAAGYSSYGNQIGLATTHVREIYHPGYTAKRMEVGAVAGAARAADVVRERPAPGDAVLLLGGRTGRDGIGGATGSSKGHTESSLERCGSEVQKGNAPQERALQCLFRRPEASRLIKRSNDFGAGGVSVAIGELAEGVDIYLDRVPVKYDGLNATELAISESQERMAVVVAAADRERFEALCAEENIEITHVADVTAIGRMRMFYGKTVVADLERGFIDSAGAPRTASAKIGTVPEESPLGRPAPGATLRERIENCLGQDNVQIQKGMAEMFDSTIGAGTVLMPFGGRTQWTETQVSAQKIPVPGGCTDTASVMAFGFDPQVSSWSPYHGAAWAVVEATAKAAAAGAPWRRMRFSYQEYFERLASPLAWGKPAAALLGALRMQAELGLPSIGGKDSMSGSFGQMHVPPTLIAFGIAAGRASRLISPEFKEAGNRIYLIRHTPLPGGMPDSRALAEALDFTEEAIGRGDIVSAWAAGRGGVAEAVCKMALGNRVGAGARVSEAELTGPLYGSIVVESRTELDFPAAEPIGRTIAEEAVTLNGERLTLDEALELLTRRYEKVYPAVSGKEPKPAAGAVQGRRSFREYPGEAVREPAACLPVFPGTNCDYDTERALRRAGIRAERLVFRNLAPADVDASTAALAEALDRSHMLVLCGGFSSGDEPDGSGKFIAGVLCNARVAAAVERLLARGGLVLGICNGFQALVKSGLLPYGRIGAVEEGSPTLMRNDINRHVSRIALTRVESGASPWLAGFAPGELHLVPVSHGEGRFTASDEDMRRLAEAGQIAFRYAAPDGSPAAGEPDNPNGSDRAVEGIVSPDGLVLGKMGHSERYDDGLMKNIPGIGRQDIFGNAAAYFRKELSAPGQDK